MSSSSGDARQSGSSSAESASTSNTGSFTAMTTFMIVNKVMTFLWFTRLMTIFFTISCFLPIFGDNPGVSYQKALMSSAATSALRLYQRLPQIQFTRAFWAQLTLEDSAHYFFYSLLFMTGNMLTASLLPVFLFALLHSCNFSLQIIDKSGQAWLGSLRTLLVRLEAKSTAILRFIALSEILLMPLSIISIFFGVVSLLTPIMYFNFLRLRYMSRRNPYSRTMFMELRVATEAQVAQPNCPAFVRNLCYRVIGFVTRLAPDNNR